jgi:two-component system, NtrC family, response regulator AtoC
MTLRRTPQGTIDPLSELVQVPLPARQGEHGIVRVGSGVSTRDEKLERTTLRPRDGAAPSLRGYRLLVIAEDAHVTHRLPATGEISLGRSDAADVQVQDPLISRVHVRIRIGPELAVIDLGSSNGTFVRGHRIPSNELVPVTVGDTIEIGSTVVIVQPELGRTTVPRPLPPEDPAIITESGRDDAMDRVKKLARRIAASSINVLLLGETGVGKEVMARRIHDLSPRAGQAFVGLNCASLPEQLFESELFGYEKGAFTGAAAPKPGLIETAHGGTVFLDEIGEMPIATQAKLLRVLEARQVLRVGGLRPRDVDVRFIAATHQNLEVEIEGGMFREDLYYRLNGITLVIPPLRERISELPGLSRAFITEACREAGLSSAPVLSREAEAWMARHTWPGNIRELRNALNRAVLLASAGVIRPEHLVTEAYAPRSSKAASRAAASAAAMPVGAPAIDSEAPAGLTEAEREERQRIVDALNSCGGNQTRAAKILGIARRTLTSRLDRLGLPRPRKGQ